jgi:hypothetical protein
MFMTPLRSLCNILAVHSMSCFVSKTPYEHCLHSLGYEAAVASAYYWDSINAGGGAVVLTHGGSTWQHRGCCLQMIRSDPCSYSPAQRPRACHSQRERVASAQRLFLPRQQVTLPFSLPLLNLLKDLTCPCSSCKL